MTCLPQQVTVSMMPSPPQVAHMHCAAAQIRHLGPGTLMAKVNLKNVYRVLPVHADDHPLLAFRWGLDVYLGMALPFGLRSVPNIFSPIADALASIMQGQSPDWLSLTWRELFLATLPKP